MPQYLVRLEHSSDQCPSSNSKVRERVLKLGSEMAALAQKLGVKFVAGPLVAGAEHLSIAVVEADNVETVQDFITRAGLSQWNTVKVSAAQPLEQSLKDLEKAPAPIY